jgi:hypothetical protein
MISLLKWRIKIGSWTNIYYVDKKPTIWFVNIHVKRKKLKSINKLLWYELLQIKSILKYSKVHNFFWVKFLLILILYIFFTFPSIYHISMNILFLSACFKPMNSFHIKFSQLCYVFSTFYYLMKHGFQIKPCALVIYLWASWHDLIM